MKKDIHVDILAQISVLRGEIDLDLTELRKVLIDNQEMRKTEVKTSTRYEDSFCPYIEVIDKIADEMSVAYHAAYGENITLTNYWGHIHDKNMSTNTHAHGNADISAVLYVSTPEECGHIVFRPVLQNIKRDDLSCSYKPKVGMYLMFPGFLDHSVTRNFSDQKRVSISFNFKKDENTD